MIQNWGMEGTRVERGFERETQSCERGFGKIRREGKKERELVFNFNNEKRGRQTGALSTWN